MTSKEFDVAPPDPDLYIQQPPSGDRIDWNPYTGEVSITQDHEVVVETTFEILVKAFKLLLRLAEETEPVIQRLGGDIDG